MTQSSGIQNHSFVEKLYGHSWTHLLESKAYGHAGLSSKALGSNNGLAQWYEDNVQYWREVQGGQIQVSAQQYQELQQWFAYAERELGLGSSWGNDSEFPSGVSDSRETKEGPTGNLNVTDSANSEFVADGGIQVVDAWVDCTVEIPPPCTGTAETTRDTRYNPAETVTKIVVNNPAVRDARGNYAQTVIFVHDGAKVTANATTKGDGTARFVDHTGTVTVGQFNGFDSKGGANGLTSRIPEKNSDGSLSFVGNGPEDVIDFNFAKRSPKAEGQTYDVQASSNFVFKNNDRVVVEQAPKGSEFDFVLTVTHADGEKDVFRLHGEKPYHCQMNGIPAHILFKTAGGEAPAGEKILTDEDGFETVQRILPQGFAEYFQINADETAELPNPATDISLNTAPAFPLRTAADTALENFAALTGKDEASILSQIYQDYFKKDPQWIGFDANFDGTLDRQELSQAMKSGFKLPPDKPDHQFLAFLARLDDKLMQQLQEANQESMTFFSMHIGKIRDRLVEALKSVYQGKAHIEAGSRIESILFEGQEVDVIGGMPGMSDPTDILGSL